MAPYSNLATIVGKSALRGTTFRLLAAAACPPVPIAGPETVICFFPNCRLVRPSPWRGCAVSKPSIRPRLSIAPGLTADKPSVRCRRSCGGETDGTHTMAKPSTILVKLVSTADTGFYYVTKKNPRNITEKLEFRKYDPVVRKHVAFKEAKIR